MRLPGWDAVVILEDADLVLYRGHPSGSATRVLLLAPGTEQPRSETLARLDRELSLRDELDPAWAVRGTDLVHVEGLPVLVLEDPGGELLELLLGEPKELGWCLATLSTIAFALERLHARGIVHGDLRPSNVMVDPSRDNAWLLGFGSSSGPRPGRASAGPAGVLTGALPYVAPERTGLVQGPVDRRSDLYSLGAIFYRMLVGQVPFGDRDTLALTHAHVAREPVPPSHHRPVVPDPVSAIAMKLLAKSPADRYQTAGGLRHDLERCLSEWRTIGTIEPFSLGEGDRTGVLEALASQAAPARENARIYEELAAEYRERRNAERELRVSKSRWRGLFETASAGIALLRPDGRFLSANATYQAMVGYSEQELRERTTVDITHEEDRAATRERIRSLAAGAVRQESYEKRYRRKDGGITWAHVCTSALPGEDEGPPLLAVVAVDVTERKEAIEKLRRSESLLHEAQRIAHTGSWRADLGTGEWYMSQEALRLFGLDPDMPQPCRAEELAHVVQGMIHPEDRPTFDRAAEAFMRGAAFDQEYRLVLAGGTVRYLNVISLSPEPSRAERVGIVMDVTERRRAEEALRRSEQRYRNLFATTSVSLWELDFSRLDARVQELRQQGVSDLRAYMAEHPEFMAVEANSLRATIDMNEATLKLHGARTKEELRPETILLPETTRAYAEGIIAMAERRPHFEMETAMRTVQGERIEVLFSITLPPPPAKLDSVVLAVLDLRASKRAEDALKRSEKRFRALVEHSADAIQMLDASGTVLYASPAVEKIFGYTPDELAGKKVQLLNEDDAEEVARLLAAVQRTPGEVIHAVRQLTRKDGPRRWVELTVGNLLHEPGVQAIVVNVRDVTDTKEAEEKVTEARAELARVTRATTLGELAASIAHEVNQPLAAVVTNAGAAARWLKHERPNLAEAQLCLQRIGAEGARAGDIITRIRGLLRRAPAQKARLDVNQAVAEVVALTRAEMRNRGVVLDLGLLPDLPPVLADRVQVQQVVLNLTMNALEAMSGCGPPREIRIVSRVTEDAVLVEVSDNGKGLDVEARERVFDAFYSTKAGGMGMGLAICRSIVEAHGGKIWAAGRSPSGAVFTFSLPAVQAGG